MNMTSHLIIFKLVLIFIFIQINGFNKTELLIQNNIENDHIILTL